MNIETSKTLEKLTDFKSLETEIRNTTNQQKGRLDMEVEAIIILMKYVPREWNNDEEIIISFTTWVIVEEYICRKHETTTK